MDHNKQSPSRLFISSPIEARDELDEKFDKCFNTLQTLISDVSETEAHDALNAMVCKGLQNHEEVSIGLMIGILSESENCARYYRDLTFITRDGLVLVLGHLNQLILEKYLKLQDSVRGQLIWLLKEMIKNSVLGVDGLCFNLLRQIAGGDVTPKNIWLAESMLDIFIENRGWLDKLPVLLATIVYTYLRLIVDHGALLFNSLQQKETEFMITLLREKFTECMIIGRDLVRLLQNVARIPDFEKLWRDMLFNPSSLSPTFTGILQLLTQRTSRRFLQCRLTPDMEKKIYFLTSQVRFGNHKRYQEWFQKQYLSTPESQSLRCDLIRFIVGVIHPTNELLCSDIIPRWAVIGWLLTTCTSNVAASNAKLSLFYDWLFYDPEKDNIMNIEPAILVMHNSMRPHPAITVTLLDFLCRIIPNFYPPLTDKVRLGIFTSLRQILEKRVLPSLSPLFDNTKLDKELRTMIKETFSEFCSAVEVKSEDPMQNKDSSDVMIIETNHMPNNANNHEAEFSDDDDDVPLAKVRLRDLKIKPSRDTPKIESIDISEHMELLDDNFKVYIVQYQNEKDSEARCEIVEKLIQEVLQEDDFDQDVASTLAACLSILLQEHFDQKLFPQDVDDDSLEESLGSPLFVIFRNLCQMPEEDPSRQPILLLLTEIQTRQLKLGYNLLYFLKASKTNDVKMSAYRDFCKTLDNRDLESCLISDLRHCQEDDIRLFCFLIPDVYTQFPNIALGNAELLNLIVACIDSTQLQDLICHILQGNLVMFRKDSFLSVLNASLEWETFEQYCLWQLIAAHNIPVDYVLPILPKLEFTAHAEALTSILLLLKQEKPSAELLKHVMFREVKSLDLFVVSVLRYWSQEHEEKLAELVASQFTKFNVSPNKRKRQPANKSTLGPSIDQMLSHLDQLRQHCKQTSFFNHKTLQHALHQVQSSCSEAQKTKFSDLFSLAEDIEEVKVTHNKLRGRKQGANAKGGNKGRQTIINSDTSEDSSEDFEVQKPKNAKKRRKAVTVNSDSD